MKETTVGKTRRAGNTDLGPAKPDDPVFKEGWTITTGLLGKRSSTPSGSTPNEADEKAQEQPTQPPQFYRKLHPSEEQMLTGLLEAHPTLTREQALEMLEAAGF